MEFAPMKCILLFDSTTVINPTAMMESRRNVLKKIESADRRKHIITYFDESMRPTTFLNSTRKTTTGDSA